MRENKKAKKPEETRNLQMTPRITIFTLKICSYVT